MREARSKELSERQQILLSSYVDNECSYFSRLRAERLLKTNSEARLFVQSLKTTSQTFKSLTTSTDTTVDLWDKIANRIEAEERAALYLGQRKPTADTLRPSFIERALSHQVWVGGLSGAAIAGAALFFISQPTKPGEILPVYTGGPVAAHNSTAFHQASLGGQQEIPNSRSAMEVDWMRGNGSFQIIQDPSDKSSIIWIRKRPSTSALQNQPLRPTPTIRVLSEQGLDVTPLGTAK